MLKPAILIMTGEETFKSVAKLAQKNQEKEKKVFFTSTEQSAFKLVGSLSKIRIKSISEHLVWLYCFLMSFYYFYYTVLMIQAT